ncbi:unnamed protein product [Lactuca saligna]|uniref:Uncharacterized protein n=1 Tax=Lactuca saligna TaxID=75948 RepID=A0AA35V414_LACSI|nr:unnamed protein product [Lactuca saligna]
MFSKIFQENENFQFSKFQASTISINYLFSSDATMAKEYGNTKSKKKDASSASLSGSADASGLRRPGRETPSKKQAIASPSSNACRSERIENHTPPSSSPIKKKQDKVEEQMGLSPLRRSDRSNK